MRLRRGWVAGLVFCLGCQAVGLSEGTEQAGDRPVGFYEPVLTGQSEATGSHLSRAAALLEKGDDDAACWELARYLADHPEHFEVRVQYAELLLHQERLGEARARNSPAPSLRPRIWATKPFSNACIATASCETSPKPRMTITAAICIAASAFTCWPYSGPSCPTRTGHCRWKGCYAGPRANWPWRGASGQAKRSRAGICTSCGPRLVSRGKRHVGSTELWPQRRSLH